MGDHRITLSIKAEFHGRTYEIKDAWWNYNGYHGVDSRVIKFFEDMWEDGVRRFEHQVWKDQESQRKIALENEERSELARLKDKYER